MVPVKVSVLDLELVLGTDLDLPGPEQALVLVLDLVQELAQEQD